MGQSHLPLPLPCRSDQQEAGPPPTPELECQFPSDLLCDMKQVTLPLWTSVSSPVKPILQIGHTHLHGAGLCSECLGSQGAVETSGALTFPPKLPLKVSPSLPGAFFPPPEANPVPMHRKPGQWELMP